MDGILVVDKKQGMTSHDVVNLVRRRFGLKKVGHAGTLDPMATGVLVILIGKATKLSQDIASHDKDYSATLTLGTESDTGDAWGVLECAREVPDFSEDDIRRVFGRFVGKIDQTPPMYSAIKVAGRRLYKMARKGLTIEVKSRTIEIRNMDITNINIPNISFDLTCSKGTYVRQLCVDIGRSFGCGAHMSELRRTRSGNYSIKNSITIEDLNKMDFTSLAGIVLAL